MELGMIGLGRMGSNMVLRLLGDGHRIMVYDPVAKADAGVVEQGAVGASTIAGLV